jgi:hypothetical protein
MASLLHENGGHRVFPAVPSPTEVPPHRVYLAGPMRGYPRWNAAAFDAAADKWRALGCEVVNPCDLCHGLDPRTAPQEKLDAVASDLLWLREVILIDCQQVCQVNAVVVLPGWERSCGATVEVSLALFLGLPVYGAVTMGRVVPKPLPWSLLTRVDDGRDWGDVWRNLPDRVGQSVGGSNAPRVS